MAAFYLFQGEPGNHVGSVAEGKGERDAGTQPLSAG